MNYFKIKYTNRNFGLDILRSIAILFVMLSHGRHLLPDLKLFSYFAHGGFFGVELFFILSGFLIGTILIKLIIKKESNSETKVLFDFWVRRWFRTLPNYYLFLFLNIIVGFVYFKQNFFDFEYFIFIQNFSKNIGNLMSESWSLSVEEWFYISFPLWLLFNFKLLKFTVSKRILFSILSYIFIFTIIRLISVEIFSLKWLVVRGIVLFRLDSIAFGVLVAYLNIFYSSQLKTISRKLLCVGMVFLLGALVIQHLNFISNYNLGLYSKVFLFTQTSLGFALIIPYFLNVNYKSGKISYIVSHFSIISYSLYLIHYSFALLFVQIFKNWYSTNWLMNYLLYWILSILTATLCYNLFEKPTTNLRYYFTKEKV